MDGHLVERRYFTGVGHRDVKPFFVRMGTSISRLATNQGYHLRTGDAIGMDYGFRRGCKSSQRDVYSAKCLDWAIHGPSCDRWDEAMIIAESLHPYWSKCSDYVRALHARNVFQILGEDINTPSEFMVCYARPVDSERLKVQGGTNTTYQIAREWEIPIYNLFYRDDFIELCQLLGAAPETVVNLDVKVL